MVNYENGKIYKIVNDKINITYFGSTTQKLSRRMVAHRSSFNKLGGCNTYDKFGNINDCKIYLIELYPSNSKEELLKRERYYIENFECINSNIPGRTKEEYYKINREKIIKKMRDNRNLKIEEVRIKDRERYKFEKEERCKSASNYYKINKDEIKKKNKEKIKCECGELIQRTQKARHIKTKKHFTRIQKCL
tara:strand:+ start:106 stop:681 length:576 start_codon:yes stop_codon:yes gene_type:complete